MRKGIYFLLPACLLIACSDPDTKSIDAGKFTIDIPENWVYEVRQGYDSYTAGIKMDKGQEATLDLGTWADTLHVDAATHIIAYETIDGKRAKVVSPKVVEEGRTGVYFGDLGTSPGGEVFHLSGMDLTRRNQVQLLEAIRTLKFKN